VARLVVVGGRTVAAGPATSAGLAASAGGGGGGGAGGGVDAPSRTLVVLLNDMPPGGCEDCLTPAAAAAAPGVATRKSCLGAPCCRQRRHVDAEADSARRLLPVLRPAASTTRDCGAAVAARVGVDGRGPSVVLQEGELAIRLNDGAQPLPTDSAGDLARTGATSTLPACRGDGGIGAVVGKLDPAVHTPATCGVAESCCGKVRGPQETPRLLLADCGSNR